MQYIMYSSWIQLLSILFCVYMYFKENAYKNSLLMVKRNTLYTRNVSVRSDASVSSDGSVPSDASVLLSLEILSSL